MIEGPSAGSTLRSESAMGRTSAALSFVHHLSVLLAALVVCAGVAGFWREAPRLAAAARDLSAELSPAGGTPRLASGTLRRDLPGHLPGGPRVLDATLEPSCTELLAVTLDDDPEPDDDELRSELTAEPGPTPPSASAPAECVRPRRPELALAPSRDGAGPALPRGPPAAEA